MDQEKSHWRWRIKITDCYVLSNLHTGGSSPAGKQTDSPSGGSGQALQILTSSTAGCSALS